MPLRRLDVATTIPTLTAGMSGQDKGARRPLAMVAMMIAHAIGRLSSPPSSWALVRCVTTAYDVRNPSSIFPPSLPTSTSRKVMVVGLEGCGGFSLLVNCLDFLVSTDPRFGNWLSTTP